MNSITASEAKGHFGEILMDVQRKPIEIKKNGKPVAVLMSRDEYSSLMETLHVYGLAFSSPENAYSFVESLQQAQAGEVFERELIDVDDEDQK